MRMDYLKHQMEQINKISLESEKKSINEMDKL